MRLFVMLYALDFRLHVTLRVLIRKYSIYTLTKQKLCFRLNASSTTVLVKHIHKS